MKNIKRWKEFNEAVWPLSIFTSEYDKQVKDIFDKIKNGFDPEELKISGSGFNYRMEETSSDSGYVNIRAWDCMGIHVYLYIGTTGEPDEEIPCSSILARKIYNFLKNKYLEMKKSKKLDILNKIA